MSKEQLKTKAGHTYVRGATAAAMLIPLAVLAGGTNLKNHNETVVRSSARPGPR